MTEPIRTVGEPAGIIGILTGLVATLVALKVPGMDDTLGPLWTALIVAVGGLVIAWRTRPIAPAVITLVVSSAVALISGYGLDLSPTLVGSLSGLVLSVLSLVAVRPQVAPVGNLV